MPATPVGAVARGLVAGAAGTAAMGLLLYARCRRGGGKDPFGDLAAHLLYGLTTATAFRVLSGRSR